MKILLHHLRSLFHHVTPKDLLFSHGERSNVAFEDIVKKEKPSINELARHWTPIHVTPPFGG
jgi:hypothetical protein